MSQDLPRLLIISELSLSKKGMGAGRTLFNLFEEYPPERLMLFTQENNFKNYPTDPPFEQQVLIFNSYYFRSLNNRVGQFINILNFQLLDWLPISSRQHIINFEPEVILVCPITAWGLLMGYKVIQAFQCANLIYFMDNWIIKNNLRWISNDIQKVAYQLLKKTDGWLMISEILESQLSNHYGLIPKHSLIIHNPVNLSNQEIFVEYPKLKNNKNKFIIAYAGSIFPMHYDALAVIAKAILELRLEGEEIELILYTKQYFWNLYQEEWKQWQVIYGSFIPYHELYRDLKQADLLLVTSSFLAEYYHIIRSSVLTKLTDYMAAGRPILSCGPNYSACNQFIKTFNCGLVCETNDLREVKLFLKKQIKNRYVNQKFGKIAFEVAKNNFTKAKINTQLYDFIKSIKENQK